MDLNSACKDYQLIETALEFLQHHRREQPDLARLAQALGLGEFQTQRLFTRWAGVSPKRFLQFLGKQQARRLLLEQRPILEVADELGLSGGSRLHDLVVNTLAMTPGEVSRAGAGLDICYGFEPTPFGECLLGFSNRGICHLAFPEGEDRAQALAELQQQWPGANLSPAPRESAALAQQVFAPVAAGDKPLAVLLRGTNFQVNVWEALLRIPEGALSSYGELAKQIGKPGASRAVGQAVGRNTIAYLIPCHRVIRSLGDFGDYRWGITRKQAMLGRECSTRINPDTADPRAAHRPSRIA